MQRIEALLLAAGGLILLSACGTELCDGTFTLTDQSDVGQVDRCYEITGSLQVQQRVTELELPELKTVGGGLELNSRLLTKVDLPALTSVKGWLIVGVCEKLEDLRGIRNVRSVGSELVIDQSAMADLDGLASLETVGGHLAITENGALADVGSLAGVGLTGELIEIRDNPHLPTCHAQWLVTQLVGFTGQSAITGNDDAATCP